jgi:transcriptional regulator with XRE-family HTH domain
MPIARDRGPARFETQQIRYLGIMGDAEPGTSFATLIANARRVKGWTQDDLERESGVSRATLSRWERGLSDRPEPEHVRAVCKALGIDPRRAAVSLGYLTEEEIRERGSLSVELEEILTMIEDPSMPPAARAEWIRYLKYLHASARDKAV